MAPSKASSSKVPSKKVPSKKVSVKKAPSKKVPTSKKAVDKWYVDLRRLSDQINLPQDQQAQDFLRWGRTGQGPIPDPINVDAQQLAFAHHMEIAPNDEPDNEDEAIDRAERFAQEHVDSMGVDSRYSHPFRHTQTKQYYHTLTEGSDFLLDESEAGNRLMPNAQTPILPRCDNPTTHLDGAVVYARDRFALVLAAYQEANPDEDFSVTEADRDHVFDLMREENTTESDGASTISAPAEPVEDVEMKSASDEDVAAATIIAMKGDTAVGV